MHREWQLDVKMQKLKHLNHRPVNDYDDGEAGATRFGFLGTILC